MDTAQLISIFFESINKKGITNALKEEGTKLRLKGLCGSSPSFVVGGVLNETKSPQLVLLNDKEEAAYFHNDLESIAGKKRVFFFPSSARVPYKIEKTDNANVIQRAEVLDALTHQRRNVIIVSYPEAIAEKVVTKKDLKKHTLDIQKGGQLTIDFINELLFEYHFERVDFVTQPGEFSIRGGIVDIFSFAKDHPYRIEFFGDEIDSIRSFDPATQLSVANYDTVSIVPNVRDKVLMEKRESFIDFLPPSVKIWLKDFEILSDKIQKEFDKAEKIFLDMESSLDHLTPNQLFLDKNELAKQLNSGSIIEFGEQSYFRSNHIFEFNQAPQPVFHKNFELLSQNLGENKSKGYQNVIVANSPKQLERLHTIFQDIDKEQNFAPLILNLHDGFIDHNLNIACYTDHQIFERFHRFRLKEGFKDAQQKITLQELTELQKGDYVTHVDYGVGQFAGLVKIKNEDKFQEAIKLVYKDSDVLYVSIHSLHRISKYSGKEGTIPKVNKLGTQAWKNLKNKTKKKIKEIAFDLIQLYAKRKASKGFQYSPDGFLQHELEASFIYEDTPDQEKTTIDVKADMESEAPMDRLVCGDVGFGKTEIAIRAAFKAACDGKQVAVLVPTTILALQHFKSFKKRLSEFPVKVDYINRFKTAKQTRETLKSLSEGEVDIIIGTHRLASKDVKFKDLGLLVIDEEQKFGVATKDKLKTLKANVDTLTLTATPIPRTLQFSLMGARDLSVINTPPPNRQPVETEHHSFNEEVIRDAVSYEIARDGQVFVINNRVQNLTEVSGIIQRLVPGARVITAHGQMDGKELEKRMLAFMEGEYDVLVATTIIESGLDIPNANTIIINNAHQFGLSDLHQMRGRVGRSNKKAFCYLLAPPMSSLTSEARKRLTAITQFSDLGSGINIAMKDLDIRGAGNMLGGEQSGFISEIGFDMFQKILDEAIKELKENEFKEVFKDEKKEFVEDVQLETDLDIMIPDDYVNIVTERLKLYKQLSDITNESDLKEYESKLIDRFGPAPDSVLRLLDSMRLKWIAKEIGFEKLVLKKGKMLGYFPSGKEEYFQSESFGRILEYFKKNSTKLELKEVKGKLLLKKDKTLSVQNALVFLNSI